MATKKAKTLIGFVDQEVSIERDREVIQRYLKGESVASIAKRIGVSPASIYSRIDYLKKIGVAIPSQAELVKRARASVLNEFIANLS